MVLKIVENEGFGVSKCRNAVLSGNPVPGKRYAMGISGEDLGPNFRFSGTYIEA